MRRILNDRRLIYPLVLAMYVGGLGVTAYLYHLDRQQQRAQARDDLLQAAGLIRAGIEQQVNTSLNLTAGMVIYVAANPAITQEQFAVAASRILRRMPYVRSMSLAKDNVVSHLYPLEANRQALGQRLLEVPQQRDMVVRAIEWKHSVIAGPVDLEQGDRSFIGRIPIYLDKERTRYWGLASVVMNVDGFFRAAGIERFSTDFDVALRGKDSQGAAGAVFYGDPTLFDRSDAVRLPVALQHGSWVVATATRAGGHVMQARSTALLAAGLIISSLLAVLLYVLLDALVALSRANQRAEQASAQKARFFAHMTHELRTPLTAIQGVISLLASGKLQLDAEQSADLLRNALRNCQRLQWIVNDMLDFKKLEASAAQPLQDVPVAALIADACDAVLQFARQYGVELRVERQVDDAVRIRGDRTRLQQVLVNLLSNAIKYSPEHGHVTVSVFRAVDGIRIEVVDQGAGVSEDKLGLIFEEFGQDKPSTRTDIPSTGLGLSISKQIVDRHGGRIGCRNLPVGCCFYVELPGRLAAGEG